MYALGSVGCVGSWFFNSLTNRVRKSLDVISLAEAVLDDAVFPLAAAFAAGAVRFVWRLGKSDEATLAAAAVFALVIEFSCSPLIVASFIKLFTLDRDSCTYV